MAKDRAELPLERYFSIIENIAISGSEMNTSAIAKICDYPVGTTHRLIQNLLETQLLEKSDSGGKNYQLGQRLLRLLHAGSNSVKIAIAVQPILDGLANELNDTCYLARLVGHKVVSVAMAHPIDDVRGHIVPGRTLAPNVAASAKAILAFQSEEIVGKALTGPLEKIASETKTDREEIKREYSIIRERKYATCWNEMENGLGAVAVPIPLPIVGTIYSIGAAGFIDHLKKTSEIKIVEVLNSKVPQLAKALTDIGVNNGSFNSF
ncbi:IclR family transcriptional regulator [Sneathiella litorea]|uniref:Helix-turn-helix domain-containing protein n=1 Tax=Sneathiella litorea TaxID=2606216 RepID=A0A6L8W8B3_9PROT|nr:IclR family transcriptional regulator C-terminal domain-containing protein [Sneathiella litorea]MZR30753.1 helix-turn-helix domain-containing protein [Sneathiella litorea]